MAGSSKSVPGWEIRKIVAERFPECWVITRKVNNSHCIIYHGPSGAEVVKLGANYQVRDRVNDPKFNFERELANAQGMNHKGTFIGKTAQTFRHIDQMTSAIKDCLVEIKECDPKYNIIAMRDKFQLWAEEVTRRFNEEAKGQYGLKEKEHEELLAKGDK